jgi:tRNA A37 methylthiotransferase MiaB
MKPRIPERIAGERVKRLLSLARQRKEAYVNRWIGKCVEMVIEHEGRGIEDSQPRLIIGTTENYLKAMIEASERVEQNIVPGRAGDSMKVVLHSKGEGALAYGGVDVLATISSK